MARVADRVLVVEDQFIIACDLLHILETAGFDVTIVRGADEAAAVLTSKQPSAAIVDLNLAGARADALIADLRRREIPCIVYSGYDTGSLPEPHLRKPSSPDKIVRCVRAILKHDHRVN